MAQKGFKLKGIDKFMKNFNKEVQGIQNRTHAGLINAVIELWRAAEPGTPIDTSNLSHSFFTVSYKSPGNKIPQAEAGGFKGPDVSEMQSDHSRVKQATHAAAKRLGSDTKPVLIFGYSANYSVWVHEAPKGVTFTRPNAHRRWLYKAMQKSRAAMLEEIRKEASL